MSIKDITPYTKQNLKLACIFAVIGISIGFLGAKNTEDVVMIVGLTAIFFLLSLLRLFYYQKHTTQDLGYEDSLIDLAFIQSLTSKDTTKDRQGYLAWLLRFWDIDELHSNQLSLVLDPKTHVYTCKTAIPQKDKTAIKTLIAGCTASTKASSRLVKRGKFEEAIDKLLWQTTPAAMTYYANHTIARDKTRTAIDPLYQEEIETALRLIPSIIPLDIHYGAADTPQICLIEVTGLSSSNFSLVTDDLQTQRRICRSYAARMSCMICETLLQLASINQVSLKFCIDTDGETDEVLTLMTQSEDINKLKSALKSKDIQAPEKLLDSMSSQ